MSSLVSTGFAGRLLGRFRGFVCWTLSHCKQSVSNPSQRCWFSKAFIKSLTFLLQQFMNYFQTVHKTVMQNAWLIYVLERAIGVRKAIHSFVSISGYVTVSLVRLTTPEYMTLSMGPKPGSPTGSFHLCSILASPDDFCFSLIFNVSAQTLTWI